MKPQRPQRHQKKPSIFCSNIPSTFLLVAAAITWTEAVAQGSDQALNRCRAIQVIAARAACYDSLVDNQPQAADAQRLMIENQRLRQEMARQRNSEAEETTELVDTIAALEKRPDGWIVTLQNGQIWQQHVTRRYELTVGQRVRIYPTIFGGGYKLTAEDRGGFIYVKRAR
ncbi:MAG: hypothetical protein EPO31_10180 [Gammaproteobacteria bacterium]|nr:MAG: hypothetical protein EPO31_10180 [Gammaproteobacteria bacterium]